MSTALDADYMNRQYDAIQWSRDAGQYQSDDASKEAIREVRRAEDELRGLQQHLANINAKGNDAANRHAETCAPLQAELENPETTIERRIAARVAVNVANDVLEREQEELKPQIIATRQAIEEARMRTGSRTAIENAFTKGSPAVREQMTALQRVVSLMDPLVRQVRSKASDTAEAVRLEKERRKTGKPEYDLDDLERANRHWQAVSDKIGGWSGQATAEMNAVRSKRVAQLYEE